MSKLKNAVFWPLLVTSSMLIAGVYAVFTTFLANPGIPEEMFTKTSLAEKKAEAERLKQYRWCR